MARQIGLSPASTSGRLSLSLCRERSRALLLGAPRRRRRFRAAAALMAAFAAAAGYLTGAVQPVPPAYAACGAAFNCTNDPTVTAVLDVVHAVQVDEDELLAVEPDDGEVFQITPTWQTTQFVSSPCTCNSSVGSAVTATVTWSDSTGWAVSCSGCNAVSGPVYSLSICGLYGCGSGPSITNSWGYRLIANVAAVGPFCNLNPRYLTAVNFTTTEVDDGNVIDEFHCEEQEAVSPTSQTWSVTDTGPFECAFNCDQSGAELLILYE
jgi:hypothetical protein